MSINAVIVRLADEGVPLAAIARSVARPFADVLLLVQEAIDAGRILVLPAPDWPQRSTRETRAPTIPVTHTRTVDDLALRLRRRIALTATEARFLALLLLHEQVSRTVMAAAVLRPGSQHKTLDVYASRLRQRGIGVVAVHGYGFALDAAGRAALMARAQDAAALPLVPSPSLAPEHP